jgi:site-specific DNA recombinase
MVPAGVQFQDDGFSGATLVRPGLEALRDLAAEGLIQGIVIYSPDRLSRKTSLSNPDLQWLVKSGIT